MYAFRKPFTAATFEGVALWGIGYKSVLVVSQVLGYTLSKFVGIKVISEMTSRRQAVGILLFIGLAHASRLLFAIVPPPYNFVFLFINGLPLGMVFGLVLRYLEGRQLTEALTAGLCASFVVSSGCVKSVGQYLIVWGVSEYWMPFVTGLLFVLPTLLSVWLLAQIPPPTAVDVAARSARTPMTGEQRRRLFSAYAFGLSLWIATYTLLTILRSVRDDFAVEIWRDLGHEKQPAVFAQSEMLVMLGVVIVNGAAILVRDNQRALQMAVSTIIVGFLVVCASLGAFAVRWIDGFSLMVLVGMGMYIPYVAFHTTAFERLIALFREQGNLGYLMYLADAMGYLGYVVVVLVRNLADVQIDFLGFFLTSAAVISLTSTIFMVTSVVYFRRKMVGQSALAFEPPR
jgi:hypothetical protein